MENHSTIVLKAVPSAEASIKEALVTLSQAGDYGQVMVSQELELASQIAELQKTDTIVLTLQAELRKRLTTLVQRRDALSRAGNRY